MKLKIRQFWLFIFSCFLVLLSSVVFHSPTLAHWADLAVAEITVNPTKTQMVITFPTDLVSFADDNRDGQLSSQEVTNHKGELEKFIGEKIRLQNETSTDGSLVVAFSRSLPKNLQNNVNTHTTLELTYNWSQPVTELYLNYDLFLPNVSTARCLATVTQGGETQNLVLSPEKKEFALIKGSVWQQIGSFILLGIEHILSGYDHVLFLVSLLMLGGGLGYLLKVVTAFTISHSVTLSLAVLNIVTLPSQFVESAIALSIVYVAGENFWRKDIKGRWILTFIFGLVHGLGFAGILKETHLSQGNLALSLASFNIGVEIGQIIIVCLAFAILHTLRKYPWELNLRRVLSAGVVAIGLFWFVQRAFGLFA
ncbi:HupE/UreJ family protein [Calothrix sp. 336/3]|uniref:HupE/UreJ family protein n=1 Tax=Calothrix sp. 336/3 TaxID=1337936 RepID=UPI00069BC3C5|nr:HupE/UreJ family protein [Calothrix sp. 336/3]